VSWIKEKLGKAADKAPGATENSTEPDFDLAGGVYDPDDEETDPEDNGAVAVSADDMVYVIEVTGGVAVSDHIGVGASAALNVITRDTNAVIGNLLDDDSVGTRGSFTAGGDVQVYAHNGGIVASLAVSGSKTSKDTQPKSKPPGNGTWGTSGSDGSLQSEADLAAWRAKADNVLEQMNSLNKTGDSTSQSGDAQWGLSISGAVTVNVVAEDTRAYVHEVDSFILPDGGLALYGENNTTIGSVAGGVAISIGQGDKAAVGVAGAFGVNWVTGDTMALLDDVPNAGMDWLSFEATRTGWIGSLAAGVAGATGQKGVAVGGSAAVTRTSNTIATGLANTMCIVDGEVWLDARDDTNIILIAGSGGFGGKAGVGAAIAFGDIDNTVSSVVENVPILGHGDDMDVNAVASNLIVSVTGSMGIGTGNGGRGGAGAGTLSLNFIDNTVEAKIVDTSMSAGHSSGDVSLLADDESSVYAFAGGFAAGKTVGLGLAMALNFLDNDVHAHVKNSWVNGRGKFRAEATEASTIVGLAVGGAGAQRFAGAGGIVANETTNDIRALVTDGSDVHTTDAVLVVAKDRSTSVALGGAGAGKFALGGAVSINEIKNTVKAEATDGTELNAEQDIRIQATDNSTMVVLAGGVGVATSSGIRVGIADKGSAGVSVNVDPRKPSAAVGASVAYNYVGGDPNDDTDQTGNVIQAYIDDATVTANLGSVTLSAASTSGVNSATFSGAGALHFSLGGSVSINHINNVIDTHVSGGWDVKGQSGVRRDGDGQRGDPYAGRLVGDLGWNLRRRSGRDQ